MTSKRLKSALAGRKGISPPSARDINLVVVSSMSIVFGFYSSNQSAAATGSVLEVVSRAGYDFLL
jgi:hypothetical protein